MMPARPAESAKNESPNSCMMKVSWPLLHDSAIAQGVLLGRIIH